jgi:hypothetical protein
MRSGVLKYLLVTFCLLGISPTVVAQENIWLPPGSQINSQNPPREWLPVDHQWTSETLLGKLLFQSPAMLGEKAVRVGLSCQSCHPNGHKNTSFFMTGLSEKPGDIDLTNRFWHEAGEDNRFNPVEIPTLRAISQTAPYGKTLKTPDLGEFTQHVIVDEFGGPPLTPHQMTAILAYMNLLEKPGSSTAKADQHPVTVKDLLALMKEPLAAGDMDQAEEYAALIREELGRQYKKAPKAPFITLSTDLKSLVQQMRLSPDKGQQALRELISKHIP